jgi:hypothetical protein
VYYSAEADQAWQQARLTARSPASVLQYPCRAGPDVGVQDKAGELTVPFGFLYVAASEQQTLPCSEKICAEPLPHPCLTITGNGRRGSLLHPSATSSTCTVFLGDQLGNKTTIRHLLRSCPSCAGPPLVRPRQGPLTTPAREQERNQEL